MHADSERGGSIDEDPPGSSQAPPKKASPTTVSDPPPVSFSSFTLTFLQSTRVSCRHDCTTWRQIKHSQGKREWGQQHHRQQEPYVLLRWPRRGAGGCICKL